MKNRLLVVNGHPHWEKSKALRSVHKTLSEHFDLEVLEAGKQPGNWDIIAEQRAIERADCVVFLFPLYWYGVPGGLKCWMDEVFTWGWAFDAKGGKLYGKKLLCCTSVGAALSSYSPEGKNRRTIEDYLSSVEQFAHYVGMEWRGVEAVQAGDWSGEALTPAMRTDWIENFSRKLDVSM
jgi:putative NADPH-quinone reductase